MWKFHKMQEVTRYSNNKRAPHMDQRDLRFLETKVIINSEYIIYT